MILQVTRKSMKKLSERESIIMTKANKVGAAVFVDVNMLNEN